LLLGVLVQLRGSHAFVVGGSTGVGAALVRRLVQEGGSVTVLALAGTELDAIGAETGARTVAADLSDLDQLDGMIDRVEAEGGPIDLLVCMAAVGPSGPFQATTAETLRMSVHVNMLSHMELVRQALPGMIARRSGTITFTGSLSTELTMIHLASYVPSKAGLTRFAYDLQTEVRDYGIRVFTFALGSVKGTPLASAAIEDPVVAFIEERAGDAGVQTPEGVAERMVEVVTSRRKRGQVAIPKVAQPLLVFKSLPDRLVAPFLSGPARKKKRESERR
jgi:NAD(P)-dependent dehydrogenase (short-subunit alcohol dehydrogenase family)